MHENILLLWNCGTMYNMFLLKIKKFLKLFFIYPSLHKYHFNILGVFDWFFFFFFFFEVVHIFLNYIMVCCLFPFFFTTKFFKFFTQKKKSLSFKYIIQISHFLNNQNLSQHYTWYYSNSWEIHSNT